MGEIVAAIIGSGVLTTLITNIFNVAEKKRMKVDGMSEMVRILAYDRIKFLCKYYLEKGFIPLDDYEDLKRMHEFYHDAPINGNGFLNDLMEQVGKLLHQKGA